MAKASKPRKAAKPLRRARLQPILELMKQLNEQVKNLNTEVYQTYCETCRTHPDRVPKFKLTNKNRSVGVDNDLRAGVLLEYQTRCAKLTENLAWLSDVLTQLHWTRLAAKEKPAVPPSTFVKPPPQDPPGGTWP